MLKPTKEDKIVIIVIAVAFLVIGFFSGIALNKCEPCTLENIDLKDAKIINPNTPADSVLIEWRKRNGSK